MGYVYLGRDPMINRILALKAIDLAAELDAAGPRDGDREFPTRSQDRRPLEPSQHRDDLRRRRNRRPRLHRDGILEGHHLSEFAAPDRLLPVDTVLDCIGRDGRRARLCASPKRVHRDIKPANIMYDSISNGLKITDFGIAKLIDVNRTRTGIVLGTPAFMSPEQLEGKNVNGHTDLFALGVSLYQLLTGLLPFRGASMTKLMFVIANEPHRVRHDRSASTCRCGSNEIVDRALAKNPADRFQTAPTWRLPCGTRG